MYQGPVTIQEKQYADRWKPGLGTYSYCVGMVPVTRYQYVCDHCGRVAQTLHQAEEPFYCHSVQCQGVQLVSIQEA